MSATTRLTPSGRTSRPRCSSPASRATTDTRADRPLTAAALRATSQSESCRSQATTARAGGAGWWRACWQRGVPALGGSTQSAGGGGGMDRSPDSSCQQGRLARVGPCPGGHEGQDASAAPQVQHVRLAVGLPAAPHRALDGALVRLRPRESRAGMGGGAQPPGRGWGRRRAPPAPGSASRPPAWQSGGGGRRRLAWPGAGSRRSRCRSGCARCCGRPGGGGPGLRPRAARLRGTAPRAAGCAAPRARPAGGRGGAGGARTAQWATSPGWSSNLAEVATTHAAGYSEPLGSGAGGGGGGWGNGAGGRASGPVDR